MDGDVGTEWSTAGDGDDAFITIDHGTETTIAAVGFRTRSMGDGSSTTDLHSRSCRDDVRAIPGR